MALIKIEILISFALSITNLYPFRFKTKSEIAVVPGKGALQAT